MIVITCMGCGHCRVPPSSSTRLPLRMLQDDVCLGCGKITGGRVMEVAPDPDIRTVLDSLAAWGERPLGVMEFSVWTPRGPGASPMVTVKVQATIRRLVVIGEIDVRARAVKQVWVSEIYPTKTEPRRLNDMLKLRGSVRDLMLSAVLIDRPVTDWNAWLADGCSPPGSGKQGV